MFHRVLACFALAAALLFAAAPAFAGASDEGHAPAGPGLINLSNNGDSLLEIDRTLNLDLGPGSSGSDHDN